MSSASKPGRLGNPDMTLVDDPRGDPRILAAIREAGSFSDLVEPVSADASLEECLDYCNAFESAASAAHPLLESMMPAFEDVEVSEETIKGIDGNDIPLFLHMPKGAEPGPCVVHTHGGGMVVMSTVDPGFRRWRSDLASQGIRAIGVEFRNGGGSLGPHPFPAGLNDCASAVQWVHENRERLGVTKIIVSGESGGGNLCIATALKAKQEGWLDQIDGIYACCPYIYGGYADPTDELPSLYENDGYTLDCDMMAALVKVYDVGQNATNPLAWPYHAELADLEGLPPHIISVNELDPLRDEGLEFYRKLLAAGVSVQARTVHGTPHAGDLGFPDIAPDIYAETLTSVCRFARSL